jgi:hypothetical protein
MAIETSASLARMRCAAEALCQARQDAGAIGVLPRQLLDSIDVSTVVGRRDRALIALMARADARRLPR